MNEAALCPIKSTTTYDEAADQASNNDSQRTNIMPGRLNMESSDKGSVACDVSSNINNMSLEQVGSVDGAVPEIVSTQENSETSLYNINGKELMIW